MITKEMELARHGLKPLPEKLKFYYYISTNADTDSPAKTLFVIAPSKEADTLDKLESFAKNSGWIDAAEKDGAVLIMPVAKNGWQNESLNLLCEIYDSSRRSFGSRKQGDSKEASLWLWETMIYLVGYKDGAVFAGNSCIANPNRFAGVALIGDMPDNYSLSERASSHWLVKNISDDYNAKNYDIPSCIWLFETNKGESDNAIMYFTKSNGTNPEIINTYIRGIETKVYRNPIETAQQVRVSSLEKSEKTNYAQVILFDFFDNFIRWKNSPDGTLKPHLSKAAFYSSDRYDHDFVQLDDFRYDFHIFVPKEITREKTEGMPVVFSLHGAHEPAWVFATKNGWEELSDETGEFIVVLPDSPYNRWIIERDGEVFKHIIDKLYTKYEIDRERIYLTGFSNGCIMTCEAGTKYPELFAALSPSNTPVPAFSQKMAESGYEMPVFAYCGDNDIMPDDSPFGEKFASQRTFLENFLIANNCTLNAQNDDAPPAWAGKPLAYLHDELRNEENWYTGEKGYSDGDRFKTYVYKDIYGLERVCYTVMKNMPHGAVYDQSRAAWEFMKRFRRPDGGKHVEMVQNE